MDFDMKVSDYKELYEKILSLTYDAEDIRVNDGTSAEEIEKCKWIIAMVETLTDVPLGKAEYMFHRKKIKFDLIQFLRSN